MKKATTKRLIAFATAIMTIVSSFSVTAFAADSTSNEDATSVTATATKPGTGNPTRGTWPVGDHYLGYCNITNGSHLGGTHTFNGNWLQVKPCWKPLDDPSKEVDMYIEVRDITTGTTPFSHLFTISEDTDGVKDNGYWYAESWWFRVYPTHTYRIYYEPFTSAGYSGTGYNRQATCVMYANVGS
jgi:hypothetical protein